MFRISSRWWNGGSWSHTKCTPGPAAEADAKTWYSQGQGFGAWRPWFVVFIHKYVLQQSCPSPFLSSFSVVETWGRWSPSCSLLPRRSPRPGSAHLQGVWNVQSLWQAGRIQWAAQERSSLVRPLESEGLPDRAGCHYARRVLRGSNFLRWRRPSLWWRVRYYSRSEKGRERWCEETEWPRGGGGMRVDDNGALWKKLRIRQFGQLKL